MGALARARRASAGSPATHPAADAGAVKVAIVGRPNVGKSTLVNTLLGEERVIAFDQPGTTRDSIYLDFERNGRQYTLIDTAGVRRRGKVLEAVEKFSVIKTLQAIEDANVVVLLLDAEQGISEQDAHLAGYILEAGRALVVAVNKWDAVAAGPARRRQARPRPQARLPRVRARTTTSRRGRARGVAGLLRSVDGAYAAAMAKLSTPKLTRTLAAAVDAPAAAARRHGAAQAALRAPGRPESAADRDPRLGARPHPGDLPPLPGTFLQRGVPTARDAP